MAPVYIFLCYPILLLAFPRLVLAVLGPATPAQEDGGRATRTALVLWGCHLALAVALAASPGALLVVSAFWLGLTLKRFHARHDLGAAALGAGLALVWEVPCTAFGAWRFPRPEVFGLIPAWLPFAYGVFFVTLGRVTSALAAAPVPSPISEPPLGLPA